VTFLAWVVVGMVLWLPLSFLAGCVVGRVIVQRDEQDPRP
jgi:membrane protein DedA with SNARE-associated domain